jgi:hypothetical protein
MTEEQANATLHENEQTTPTTESTPELPLENQYLKELQELQAAIAAQNKKMAEWKPPGFPHAKRDYRRARNYKARSSRKYNRLRAKGKRV